MYEVITILNPNVSSEFIEGKISDWTDLVKEYGAEIQRIDRWGKKNLAYEVKKFNQGFFLLFHIKGNHDVVDELERRFRIADEVIRYQTVKMNEREYRNSVELLDQMKARAREEAERRAEAEARRSAVETAGDTEREQVPEKKEPRDSRDKESPGPELDQEKQATGEKEADAPEADKETGPDAENTDSGETSDNVEDKK